MCGTPNLLISRAHALASQSECANGLTSLLALPSHSLLFNLISQVWSLLIHSLFSQRFPFPSQAPSLIKRQLEDVAGVVICYPLI